MCCANVVRLHSVYEPALNGSSALEHFKSSNAGEVHNGIMFDFYLRLSLCFIIFEGFL